MSKPNRPAQPPSPQQPDLRSFIVYQQLPPGCVAFEVPDDTSVPFLRAGEFVVIDPTDCEPAEGELFAITWKSASDQSWEIVQMDRRDGRFGYGDAVPISSRWFVGAPAPKTYVTIGGELAWKPMRWVDGPYNDDYLREITHGRVIGILEPDFQLMLLSDLAADAGAPEDAAIVDDSPASSSADDL